MEDANGPLACLSNGADEQSVTSSHHRSAPCEDLRIDVTGTLLGDMLQSGRVHFGTCDAIWPTTPEYVRWRKRLLSELRKASKSAKSRHAPGSQPARNRSPNVYRRKPERARVRQKHAPRAEPPTVALVEEEQDALHKCGKVTISVVHDLSKVLDAKSTRLHGDILDAVVELVVELLDEEIARGEAQDR